MLLVHKGVKSSLILKTNQSILFMYIQIRDLKFYKDRFLRASPHPELRVSGISQLAAKDGKHLADPEVLRRLTSSVSCALDEAAAALTRMRSDNPRAQPEKTSLVEACTDGDVGTVRKLLTEGRSVHETSDEGESLLSLACSAGYYELAQVTFFSIEATKL
jgi:hypothetical protein